MNIKLRTFVSLLIVFLMVKGLALAQTARSFVLTTTLLHESNLSGAKWIDSNRSLITWGEGFATVWDSEGNILLDLPHDFIVQGASFHDVKRQLLTWGRDQLMIWEANQIISHFEHEASIIGARWSASGENILSWSEDGSARIWSIRINDFSVFPHNEAVLIADWSPDETMIFTVARGDTKVRIWQAESQQILTELPHNDIVRGARWSEDGTSILTWSLDGTAKLWSSSGELLQVFSHEDEVSGASWSPNELYIATWSWIDNQIKLWGVEGNIVAVYELASPPISLLWNANSQKVLFYNNSFVCDATCAYQAHLWAVPSEEISTTDYETPIIGLYWNVNETMIAVLTLDTVMEIRDINGNTLSTIESDYVFYGMDWSNNPNQLLTWDLGNTVRIWSYN